MRTANDTTSFAAQLPATVNAGDRVLAVISWTDATGDNNLTPAAGWTFVGQNEGSDNEANIAGYYRDAAASLGGTSATWAFSASTDANVAYMVYTDGTFSPWRAPQWGGDASNSNPGTLAPTWGQYDVQWLDLIGAYGTASVVTPDAAYTGTISQVTTGTRPLSSGVAFRDLNAVNVNPGAWTVTGAASARTAVMGVLGEADGVRARALNPTNTATTTWTMTIPDTVQTGDDLVVIAASRDHDAGTALATLTDNDAGGNTWTLKSNSTDRKGYVFWKKATAASAGKTVTFASAVGSSTGGLVAFYGRKTGDPFNNLSIETNASGDESHAGFAAAADSIVCLAMVDYSNDNVVSTGAGATLGSLGTVQFTNISTGGSDCAASLFSLLDAAGGATGTLSWAQTNGTTYSWAFELLTEEGPPEPPTPAASGRGRTRSPRYGVARVSRR